MVYTTRFARGQGGPNHFETLLRQLGITQKNGAPNHPQTQGKIERFQQTFKKWLRAQPDQPTTLAELQQLIDRFRNDDNANRPHRSLPHRATPAARYTTGIKAGPSRAKKSTTHDRVRTDRVDDSGVVTLRVDSKLRHIGFGRTHDRTHVKLLIQDLDVTVINAITGEVLRELSEDYQPTGNSGGPTRRTE